MVPLGTRIYAVANGRVTLGPYPFYHGTHAIEVNHGKFTVRYCEIRGAADGIAVGSIVAAHDCIAYVGRMFVDSMLHFEMYSNRSFGPLTVESNPGFQRRADLIDPAPYLDRWALEDAEPYDGETDVAE
jgi:murein DD-endopeptidase MepM/ murein hydrolase activator NlpD